MSDDFFQIFSNQGSLFAIECPIFDQCKPRIGAFKCEQIEAAAVGMVWQWAVHTPFAPRRTGLFFSHSYGMYMQILRINQFFLIFVE